MKITFRGAVLKRYTGIFKPNSDPIVRMYFKADLSDTVIKKMGWGDEFKRAESVKFEELLKKYSRSIDEKKQEPFRAEIMKLIDDANIVADGIDSGNLSGTLAAKTMTLTPASNQLRDWITEWEIKEVGSFSVVSIHDDQADTIRRELRFMVISSMKTAAGLAETFMQNVGEHKCSLRAEYERQMVLGEGAGEEDPDEDDAQGTLVGGEESE